MHGKLVVILVQWPACYQYSDDWLERFKTIARKHVRQTLRHLARYERKYLLLLILKEQSISNSVCECVVCAGSVSRQPSPGTLCGWPWPCICNAALSSGARPAAQPTRNADKHAGRSRSQMVWGYSNRSAHVCLCRTLRSYQIEA